MLDVADRWIDSPNFLKMKITREGDSQVLRYHVCKNAYYFLWSFGKNVPFCVIQHTRKKENWIKEVSFLDDISPCHPLPEKGLSTDSRASHSHNDNNDTSASHPQSLVLGLRRKWHQKSKNLLQVFLFRLYKMNKHETKSFPTHHPRCLQQPWAISNNFISKSKRLHIKMLQACLMTVCRTDESNYLQRTYSATSIMQ